MCDNLKYHRKYYREHKEYFSSHFKKYCEDNPDYFKNNRNIPKVKAHLKSYVLRKMKIDSKFKINTRLQTVFTNSLKGRKGYDGARYWESLLGYTLEDLKEHLKSIIPEGFTWQNYIDGKLEMDHIIPKKEFVFKSVKNNEFKKCWALCNLRLVTPEVNRSKGTKILINCDSREKTQNRRFASTVM